MKLRANGKRTVGRAGGRAGGSGYHFQDLYVALQLASLLIAPRPNQPREVMWEKQAVDWGEDHGTQDLSIADVIVVHREGATFHTQVKETAPGGRWTVAELLRTGIIKGFWEEWQGKSLDGRLATKMRLASAGDVTPLRQITDVAQRCRTYREVFTSEAHEEIAGDLKAIAKALQVEQREDEFLEFLKALDGQQLPAADALRGWVVQSLAAFGAEADNIAQRLISLVAQSKHLGDSARSSYTRDGLVSDLRAIGTEESLLMGLGALSAPAMVSQRVWEKYRAGIVAKFSTFRLYGGGDHSPLTANLAQAYVPLRFSPISKAPTEEPPSTSEAGELPLRNITLRAFGEPRPEPANSANPAAPAWKALPEILEADQRVAFVGGPGTGKTTTLRWLTLICALSGTEGRTLRLANGLPPEPLLPIFVRFRELADRILARNLHGVAWRASLITDFISAQLEAGLLGTAPTRQEALGVAQALLDSRETVLLFDGLDEIADADTRELLFDALSDLMRTARELRIISSWRPHALQRDLTKLDLKVFQPLPMNSAERRAFALHWYESLRPEYQGDDTIESRAEDLFRSADRLTELAEVPLLFAIVALVHFDGAGLPVQRSVLYQRATQAMLGHWEIAKAGSTGERRGSRIEPRVPSESLLKQAVGYLAYFAQCEVRRAEISSEIAHSAICRSLEKELQIAPSQVEGAGAELLKNLVEKYGLLQERAPGVVAFAHLSFQEYLAADWLTSQTNFGSALLTSLVGDERQAEVARFAVAILAESNDNSFQEAGRALVQAFAVSNPVLAATCLWDSPTFRIPEAQAEEVARELWFALSDFRHHRVHPEVFSRLFWNTLSSCRNADRIFLEILASGNSERHKPMGGEGQYIAFVTRPAGRPSALLEWYLKRLVTVAPGRDHFRFPELAHLFLVEAELAAPESCLRQLVSILDRNRWWPGSIESEAQPERRAEKILRRLLANSAAGSPTMEELRQLTTDKDVDSSARRRLIQVLLELGEPLTAALADLLVDAYLSNKWEHERGIQQLKDLSKRPNYQEPIVDSVQRGLASKDRDKREGCLRFLQALEMSPAPPGSSAAEDKAAPDTLAELLWDEDRDIAWRAASALLARGCTDIPGLPHALVNVGLGAEASRGAAAAALEALWSHPPMAMAVRACLLEGIRSASAPVATAAAVLLMRHPEATTPARAHAVTTAALKDPVQLAEVAPMLEGLLTNDATCSGTLKAIGTYFEGVEKRQISSALVTRVVELGHLDCPGLSRALVFGPLADPFLYDAAILQLRQLLDQNHLVTTARQALVSGLKSKNRAVVWGAVRCLWESGSRVDPELPGALIEAGFAHEGTHDDAQRWMLELLTNSRTTKGARAALAAKAQGFRWAQEQAKDYDLAWEIAQCACAAKIFDLEDFPELLVFGGFQRRERHDLARRTIENLCSTEAWLEEEICEALVSALKLKNREVSWGAATIFFESWPEEPSSRLPKIQSHAGQTDLRDRVMLLIKVALRERYTDPKAQTFLAQLHDDEPDSATRQAFAKILKDKEEPGAYQAAEFLLEIGRLDEPALANALVSVGLRNDDGFETAAAVLDKLRLRGELKARVWEALNRALWSENESEALGAARYLFERGDVSNPGVSRAFVFGGLRKGSWRNAVARRYTLACLRNPTTRAHALLALEAFLGWGHPIENFEVVSLLLQNGGTLSPALLKGLSEMLRWHPESVLAAVALSDRIPVILNEAKRLGLQDLVAAIGEE